MRRLFLLWPLAAVACRAAPIPEARRYPGGTPFRAETRVIDGTRLRLVDTGRGTPVVLIHGLGASIYSWRHTIGPVAAGHRVIAFDNRGFGFSGKPARGYARADYVRLVVALLDSLGAAEAVLVGHSMGGAIAAEVALAHPDRVRGLVLINTAGYGVRWPVLLKVARWPVVGRVVGAFRGKSATGRILRAAYADPTRVTGEDVEQYYAPIAEPGADGALRGVLREFRFDSLAGRLAAVQAPTLVVWGANDRWIPVRDGSRLAAELPRAVFTVIPGAGHATPEEAPEAVNRLLLAFLQDGLPRIPENLAWSTPSLRSSRSNSPSTPLTRPRSGS